MASKRAEKFVADWLKRHDNFMCKYGYCTKHGDLADRVDELIESLAKRIDNEVDFNDKRGAPNEYYARKYSDYARGFAAAAKVIREDSEEGGEG